MRQNATSVGNAAAPRRVVILLTFGIALCIPLNALAQDNLVANPGFEEGAGHWGLKNDWYATNDPKRASPAVIDKANAHSGNACLRIDGQGSRGLAIQSPIKLQAGVKYRVSCWMKADNMKGALAGPLIEFWTADNVHIKGRFWAQEIPGDWERISWVIYPPRNAAYAKIMCATNTDNEGQVWFDDIEIRLALPPAPVPVQAKGRELVWENYDLPASVAYYRVYAAKQPFSNVALMKAVAWLPLDVRRVDLAKLPGTIDRRYFAVVAVNKDDIEDPKVTCVGVRRK